MQARQSLVPKRNSPTDATQPMGSCPAFNLLSLYHTRQSLLEWYDSRMEWVQDTSNTQQAPNDTFTPLAKSKQYGNHL